MGNYIDIIFYKSRIILNYFLINKSVVIVHIISFIWFLVIVFSIANREGKLYWIINFLSLFPTTFTLCFYGICINNGETNIRIKFIPMMVTVDAIVHFCYFIQVFMISIQYISTTGSTGPMWCMIPSFILFVVFL